MFASNDGMIQPQMINNEENSVLPAIKENIFPYADVKIAKSLDKEWMVWNDDNPERSSMNRSQIMFSILSNNDWSEPKWIDNDGTNDFNPTIASNEDGALIAWEDIKQSLGEDVDLNNIEIFENNCEISVTQDVYQSVNSNVEIVTLTDDDKYDHSPNLALDGENGILTWIKSDENGDRLMYSSWDGSRWSHAETIEQNLSKVVDVNAFIKDSQGLLLYTLDMDNDLETVSDQEVFARKYKNGVWQEAIRITDNELQDFNPKSVYSNGKWFITWYQDSYIMYQIGLEGKKHTEEFLSRVSSDFDIEMKDQGEQQIVLVYKKYSDNGQRELSMVSYDILKGLWSDEIQLTDNNKYIRSFDTAFTDDGALKVAYTEAEMETEIINGNEYVSPSDKVDLKTLTYVSKHDLALENLTLSNQNPLSGSRVNITATVKNTGDYAENAIVAFYKGNPQKNGIKIGEKKIVELMPARTSNEVEVTWIADAEDTDQYDIYAVIASEDNIIESNESNNTYKHSIIRSDAEILDPVCENFSKDDYLLSFKVLNAGSKLLNDINIYLRNGGEIVKTLTIDELEALQETYLEILFNASDLTKDEEGNITMDLSAQIGDGIKEFDLSNNTYTFTLEKKPIEVRASNITEGQNSIGINQAIEIDFNMDIQQGESFDNIKVNDIMLNEINIDKTIEGNTLTITPVNSINYNTPYTLTIPKDAFSDEYGHSMEQAYSLNFTTGTSNPQVIFSYPVDGIEGTAINEDIRFKFNQNILKGVSFEDISLKNEGDKEIPITVSNQGKWLYIDPSDNLDNKKSYTVSIAAGAICNDKGQILKEDYAITFKTGEKMYYDNDDDDDDENNNQTDTIKKQDDNTAYIIGEVETRIHNGQEIQSVKINTEKLKNYMKNLESKETITFSANKPWIEVGLKLQDIENMIQKDLAIEVRSNKGAYKVDTTRIDMEQVLEHFGGAVSLSNIKFDIRIKNTDEDMVKVVEDITKENGLSIVAPPVDFEIVASHGEKTFNLKRFKGLVRRMIPIPEGTDIEKVTTAIVTDSDGAFYQVPTFVTQINGEHYAVIKSITNSTYTLINNKVNCEDLNGHWAQGDIIKLTERLIFEENEVSNPEEEVSRAMMVKFMVKALGIKPKVVQQFVDIPPDSGEAPYIGAAYDYGITQGTSETVFSPNLTVTREQAMTFVYRTAKLLGNSTNNLNIDMKTYRDYNNVSEYAKNGVKWNVSKGIINGTSNTTLSPKEKLTKAQVAAIINRFLLKHFINLD